MTSAEQLKQTFFDECDEALHQIESGLVEIREGQSSDETVNAVFRAVHSVKGGAGIFGFDALVGFAHVFETVLDAVRSQKLAVTNEVLDVLIAANDVLADLVTMSRTSEEIPSDFGSAQRAALESLMSDDGLGGDNGEPAPADFEGLDFVPVKIDDFDDSPEPGADAGGLREFSISFRPRAEMLRRANEPLYIIRELRKLGELDLTADLEHLPPLAELEADRPYIGWTGTLRTGASLQEVEEVFEFVGDDCELEIAEVRQQPAVDEPAFETIPLPVTTAAAKPGAELPEHQAASIVPSPGPVHAAAPVRAQTPPTKPTSSTTRVGLDKIDRVVNMVGELVISQAMLGQIVQDLPDEVSSRLEQVLDQVIQHTRELKDSVMSMRAQAIGAVFERMPRLVRELAGKTGKKVKLEMRGEGTEVDRSIIERLGDPLTHIIRNSVDHGIERPEVRLAAGKPEEGTVTLLAEHRGARIVIEITDDGGGIDPERVFKKACERGLVSADAVLSEDEINNLIFLPGFSTAEVVSDISGRGVGMDVVRRNIQDLGGRISVKSERGRGMTLQLTLPLTLAVMDGMVIKAAGETYVLPISVIVECLRPKRSDVYNLVGDRGMLQLRGNVVPLVYLADILELDVARDVSDESVIIIADAGDDCHFGIVVDELCGHQQVVVKSLEESYGVVPGVAGATILGNGRVSLILDIEKLSELAVGQLQNPTDSTGESARRSAARRQSSSPSLLNQASI